MGRTHAHTQESGLTMMRATFQLGKGTRTGGRHTVARLSGSPSPDHLGTIYSICKGYAAGH